MIAFYIRTSTNAKQAPNREPVWMRAAETKNVSLLSSGSRFIRPVGFHGFRIDGNPGKGLRSAFLFHLDFRNERHVSTAVTAPGETDHFFLSQVL